VKLAETELFNRWLIPIAGGPNSPQALQLLPALITLGQQPEVRICQVFEPEPAIADMSLLRQTVQDLSDHLNCPIIARPLWGNSVPEAVVKLAWREYCDVIMLGASRESLLEQMIRGNIPAAIARDSNRTVILVRGAISLRN
jgi:CIC family chloride channel protein